jgi:hypothetical protein
MNDPGQIVDSVPAPVVGTGVSALITVGLMAVLVFKERKQMHAPV